MKRKRKPQLIQLKDAEKVTGLRIHELYRFSMRPSFPEPHGSHRQANLFSKAELAEWARRHRAAERMTFEQ
jgi:predicted DNA-binding transcriptional regulator AlpA